jgi:uncharacterized membrane protein YdbT with pleckstrin-like domain
MSYVEKNLLPGETIVYEGHLHWIMYAGQIGMAIIGLAFLVPNPWNAQYHWLWMVGGAIVALSLLSALPRLFAAMATELVVTSKRVVAKRGVVQRETFEMLHKKVESISVHQTILGRVLGYGDVVIHGTGGGQEVIPGIASPLKFRNAAMAQSDAA